MSVLFIQYISEKLFMAKYYVNENPQPTGEHEVHKEGCSYLPEYPNKKYLGDFSKCEEAVNEAKKYYNSVDGCYYCSNECHTR
jgi:hypothetical protein